MLRGRTHLPLEVGGQLLQVIFCGSDRRLNHLRYALQATRGFRTNQANGGSHEKSVFARAVRARARRIFWPECVGSIKLRPRRQRSLQHQSAGSL